MREKIYWCHYWLLTLIQESNALLLICAWTHFLVTIILFIPSNPACKGFDQKGLSCISSYSPYLQHMYSSGTQCPCIAPGLTISLTFSFLPPGLILASQPQGEFCFSILILLCLHTEASWLFNTKVGEIQQGLSCQSQSLSLLPQVSWLFTSSKSCILAWAFTFYYYL